MGGVGATFGWDAGCMVGGITGADGGTAATACIGAGMMATNRCAVNGGGVRTVVGFPVIQPLRFSNRLTENACFSSQTTPYEQAGVEPAICPGTGDGTTTADDRTAGIEPCVLPTDVLCSSLGGEPILADMRR